VREEGSKAVFLNSISQNDQSFSLGGLDFAAFSCMYVFCTSTTLRIGLTQNHSWMGGSGLVQCHCKYSRKKKQTKGRRKETNPGNQREREREREGNTKQTNKESLPQERK
jgi:hypothetical protein